MLTVFSTDSHSHFALTVVEVGFQVLSPLRISGCCPKDKLHLLMRQFHEKPDTPPESFLGFRTLV